MLLTITNPWPKQSKQVAYGSLQVAVDFSQFCPRQSQVPSRRSESSKNFAEANKEALLRHSLRWHPPMKLDLGGIGGVVDIHFITTLQVYISSFKLIGTVALEDVGSIWSSVANVDSFGLLVDPF